METVISFQQDGVADRIHFKDGESFRTAFVLNVLFVAKIFYFKRYA
ncbi:hypothetical protein IVB22_28835 [Bradyrhizobium sp. 190]|nr:hypothetical protein [Bradyrhizobium sp. 190]